PAVRPLPTALSRSGSLDRRSCAYFTMQSAFLLRRHAALAAEVPMSRDVRVAVLGFLLLLPALVLVSSGLLGLERPDALVHPILVMGGLFLALALNALPVFRVRFGHEEGALVGTASLRLRGTVLNLTALSLSGLLLATIMAYLFVENFQPR
ncbi:MAG: hypothetical protein WAU32_06110, partial [Thermoanaerobaculia bacterium]